MVKRDDEMTPNQALPPPLAPPSLMASFPSSQHTLAPAYLKSSTKVCIMLLMLEPQLNYLLRISKLDKFCNFSHFVCTSVYHLTICFRR